MSKFSIGQMNQVGNAMEAAGWDEAMVSRFGQSGRLADIRAFLEGRAEIVIKAVEEVAKMLFILVKTITVVTTKEKKTADCFKNKKRYYHLDPDLDKWLPKVQEARVGGLVAINRLTENSRFIDMVQSLLSTTATSLAELLKLAIERKQVFTLTQIEMLIERQDNGEDVGLLTNGYANFFLVLNKEGGVSVVSVDRYVGQWRVYVHSLYYARVWTADYHFFSRN